MKTPREGSDAPNLDALNTAIRAARLDEAEISASATKVWQRIAAAAAEPAAGAPAPNGAAGMSLLRGCADIQALAPAYHRNALDAGVRLLVEDHLATCVACRAAFAGRSVPAPSLAPPFPATNLRRHPMRWAAVGLAVAAAIVVAIIYVRVSPAAGEATVLAASGPVYQLGANGPALVHSQWLDFGPRYRNAGQTQLRLPDGSRLDLRAHSEFALSASGRGAKVRLIAGDVIVEAAHQTGGRHFQVAAPDATFTSLGTIFAVQQGLKGAHLAVLRGSVRVDYPGHQTVVPAGSQLSTNPAIENPPLTANFAWSANAPHYLALAASLARLRHALAQVPPPQLRYQSTLAHLLPANTVFFASLPNLHGQLAASYQVLQRRLQQDPVLRQWWRRRNPGGAKWQTTVQPFLQLGADLGPEIVIAAGANGRDVPASPLLLARLVHPNDFVRRLRQFTARARGGKTPRIWRGRRPPSVAGAGPLIWLHGGLLAAALGPAPLRQLYRQRHSPSALDFTATPFYQRVRQTYAGGVSVLVAANVHSLLRNAAAGGRAGWPQRLGFANATAFIATVRQAGGITTNRADLAFASQRRGLAAWLAPPRPMQTLSYVSPQPRMAFAMETIAPADLAAQIMQLQSGGKPAEPPPAWLQNLLAPLSGEFAVAMDGPLLPTPNWIFAAGVTDPAALQSAIAAVLIRAGAGVMTPATVAGHDAYRLTLPNGFHFVYLYTGGDLLAAPSSAWLTQALRYHSSGYNLLHSHRFLAALPVDDQVNCSAIYYQNLGPTLNQIFSLPGAGSISPQQRQSFFKVAAEAPTAACAYAAPDRLTLAMNGATGPLDFFEHSLIGAQALDFGPLHSVVRRNFHPHAAPPR